MQAVVGFGQTFLACQHGLATVFVVGFADYVKAVDGGGEGEGLEAVRGRVAHACLQCRTLCTCPLFVY